MKTITISTTPLTNAVSVAASFTPRDGDFAGKLVLVGQDGMMEVKVSSVEQTLIYKNIQFTSSDLTDHNFDAFSVDAKKLLVVLKNAKTDVVEMKLYANHVIIKSGRSEVKIETLAKVQNIEILENQGNKLDFSSQIGLIDQVLHAVDSNNPKFELNGVLLQIKSGLFNIVATDTKRLPVITTATELEDMEVIIQKHSAQTISRLFYGLESSAEIANNQLSVFSENIVFSARLTAGKFPDWQRIIPKDNKQSVIIGRERLEGLVKDASLLCKDIVIDISDNHITLYDDGHNTEVIEEFENNADIRFGVKAKYILDFISSFKEENIQITFKESNLPVLLIASPEYREAVMPIVGIEFKQNTATEQEAA